MVTGVQTCALPISRPDAAHTEDIVLYRQADGTAAALEDRCCHRNLPLSMGDALGNTLVCSYHGLAYDSQGLCVNIPWQDKIPANARVRQGQPKIPHFDELTQGSWTFDQGNSCDIRLRGRSPLSRTIFRGLAVRGSLSIRL